MPDENKRKIGRVEREIGEMIAERMMEIVNDETLSPALRAMVAKELLDRADVERRIEGA